MSVLVSSETIAEITREFWGAFLPGEPELLPGAELPATVDLQARVDVAGGWRGSIELSCSAQAGRRVAAAMFGLSESELGEPDVADAVGELVNVVGGSIKSILPAPSTLSVPRVNDQSEWRFRTELESEVLLSWGDEPIIVRVWRLPESA